MNRPPEATPTLEEFDAAADRFRQASIDYSAALDGLLRVMSRTYDAMVAVSPDAQKEALREGAETSRTAVAVLKRQIEGAERDFLIGAGHARDGLELIERAWPRPKRAPPS